MEVHQVYDRDTGVYYAITEQGGICVMRTADGQVKLIDGDNGSGEEHPDKGVED